MKVISIKINPTKMIDPDVDIRYDLFDYLVILYPNLFVDLGYKYIGDNQIMEIKIGIKIDLVGLQYEAIIDSILDYQKFGSDFRDAAEVEIK